MNLPNRFDRIRAIHAGFPQGRLSHYHSLCLRLIDQIVKEHSPGGKSPRRSQPKPISLRDKLRPGDLSISNDPNQAQSLLELIPLRRNLTPERLTPASRGGVRPSGDKGYITAFSKQVNRLLPFSPDLATVGRFAPSGHISMKRRADSAEGEGYRG